MKFFENIMHDHESEFLKESGFRKLFSTTTTAVLDASETILEQLDKNNYVAVY